VADESTELEDLKERFQRLQRAVYYLVWKRTGFGDQCLHCGSTYPKHLPHCRAAEIEALVR
jgi:hypothetical protein